MYNQRHTPNLTERHWFMILIGLEIPQIGSPAWVIIIWITQILVRATTPSRNIELSLKPWEFISPFVKISAAQMNQGALHKTS